MSCKLPLTIISNILKKLEIILTDPNVSKTNKEKIRDYAIKLQTKLHSSSSSKKLLKGGFKLFQFLSALNAFLAGIHDTASPTIEPTTLEAIEDVSLLSKEIVTCNETAPLLNISDPLPLLNISDPGDIIPLNNPLPKLATARNFLVNLKYSNETETDTVVPVFGVMSRPEEYSNYVDEIVESFLYTSNFKPKIEGQYYDQTFMAFDINLTPYGLNINLKHSGIFFRHGMTLKQFASSTLIEEMFIKGLELFMYHAGAYDMFNAVFDKTNDAFSIKFLATDNRSVKNTDFHRDPIKGPLLLIYDNKNDMIGPEVLITKDNIFGPDPLIFRSVFSNFSSFFLNQFSKLFDDTILDEIPQKQYPPSFRALDRPVQIVHSSPALRGENITDFKNPSSISKRIYYNESEIAEQNKHSENTEKRPRFLTVQTIGISKVTEESNEEVRKGSYPVTRISKLTGLTTIVSNPEFAMLHDESFFELIRKDEPSPPITFNLDYKISPKSLSLLVEAYSRGAAANREAKQLTYDTDGLLSLFRNTPARAELENDITGRGRKKKRVNIFDPFAKRKTNKRKPNKYKRKTRKH